MRLTKSTGSDESEKTAILKQMRIEYYRGSSVEERRSYKTVIFHNLIDAMQAILNTMDKLGIDFEDSGNDVSFH
jgi:hypothetical protein